MTYLELSVGLTGQVCLLDIECLFTQGSRRGRSSGDLVGGVFDLDGSNWSNSLRYHNFDIKPDTETEGKSGCSCGRAEEEEEERNIHRQSSACSHLTPLPNSKIKTTRANALMGLIHTPNSGLSVSMPVVSAAMTMTTGMKMLNATLCTITR